MPVDRAIERNRLIDRADNGAASDARIGGRSPGIGLGIVSDRRLTASATREVNQVLLQRVLTVRRSRQGRG